MPPERSPSSWMPGAADEALETEYSAALPPPVHLKPGWTLPRPATLPPPTYWPAALALGIVLILWGLVSTFIVTGIGLVLFVLALAGWIGELLRAA